MLKYIGHSSLPGIPARDLTETEVSRFGKAYLLTTGLYVEVKMKQPKYENKNLVPDKQDKDYGEKSAN